MELAQQDETAPSMHTDPSGEPGGRASAALAFGLVVLTLVVLVVLVVLAVPSAGAAGGCGGG